MIERGSESTSALAMDLASEEVSGLTAGQILRQAREVQRMDLSVLAATLKVPEHKLEALEADDYASFADPVFTRALAASVCRNLHIDPEPVLARMPRTSRAEMEDTRPSVGASFDPSRQRVGHGWPSLRLWVVVAVLLLGAVALWLLPQSLFERGAAAPSGTGSAAQHSPAPAAQNQATEEIAHQASTPAGDAAAQPQSQSQSQSPQPFVLGDTAAQHPPAQGAASPAAPAASAAQAGSQIVGLTARGDSWVSVTDAGGQQLIRRHLQAGETVGFSGALPLSVVVGRAANVDVQVRGQAFDLAPVTRSGGTAQFKIDK